MKTYIVGTSGSGKSTLARKLSEIYDIKHIEMDTLLFEPNWQKVSDDVFEKRLRQEMKTDSWVMCGNYSRTQEFILPLVDQIIWLDYSFLTVIWRVFWRSLHRIITQTPVCNGNYETFSMQFASRYSVILWAIQTYSRRKKQYSELMASGKYNWVHLQSQKETDVFLESIVG